MNSRFSETLLARRSPQLIVRRNRPVITRADEIEFFKRQFLEGLEGISRGIATLRQAVVQLLDMDVDRDEMLAWATQAGYKESYVRSLLSQVLVAAGRRARATGAGRKTSPEALALMRYAVRHYHQEAPKVLLAAYRAAVRQQREARRAETEAQRH